MRLKIELLHHVTFTQKCMPLCLQCRVGMQTCQHVCTPLSPPTEMMAVHFSCKLLFCKACFVLKKPLSSIWMYPLALQLSTAGVPPGGTLAAVAAPCHPPRTGRDPGAASSAPHPRAWACSCCSFPVSLSLGASAPPWLREAAGLRLLITSSSKA